ncbi:hypothetical protein A2U01_0092795, partial [Trifolium medium]|nr:hypothetical protein [Trifolium medium]
GGASYGEIGKRAESFRGMEAAEEWLIAGIGKTCGGGRGGGREEGSSNCGGH